MILPKQLLFLSVAVVLCSSLLGTAKAEMVTTFEFTGQTQVTLNNGSTFNNAFFGDVDFEILVSIPSNAPDLRTEPFNSQLGSFSGATTTVSLDFSDAVNQAGTADIVDAVATNVTGITQDSNGGSNFFLVNPINIFNPALRVNLATGTIPDPNSINPFTEPVTVTNFGNGGVNFDLALPEATTLTFNTIFSLSAANASVPPSANVPEPTSFSMLGLGLLTVSLRRRRRKRSH